MQLQNILPILKLLPPHLFIQNLFLVKRNLLLMVVMLYCSALTAQKELHIHHINIGNGDATMIGIFDKPSGKYSVKMLIDGGLMAAKDRLLPYIQKICEKDDEPTRFKYAALTHYHNDHYNGLLAFKKGDLTCDTLIDPGGYELDGIFPGHHPASEEFPETITNPRTWFNKLDKAVADGFIGDHSKLLVSFGTGSRSDIGKTITLGKIGNDKVQLQCVAGWGNTLSKDGIEPNPDPAMESPNNLCLAFVLTCGEFRYFIGGDMGGPVSDDGAASDYVDQETPLSTYFAKAYGTSHAWTGTATAKGHLCGYKASHHGSDHSNSTVLLKTMRPTITITSAGDKDGWHLPSKGFLKRLSTVTTISSGKKQGVYFTNLQNFSKPAWNSKTTATQLFNNKPNISFDYGNKGGGDNAVSYLIKVVESETLGDKSSFEVGRVDISKPEPYTKLTSFNCHKK